MAQVGHGGCVVGNAVAMKGGLHHAALAEPEIAFAGEEAVAEEMAIGAEDAALDEFSGVVDDNVFDVVGVKEEVGAEVEEAQADDVAVLPGGAGHEAERVLAERAAEAVEETLFGAGRVEGWHGEMVCECGGKWKWREVASGKGDGEREEKRDSSHKDAMENSYLMSRTAPERRG